MKVFKKILKIVLIILGIIILICLFFIPSDLKHQKEIKNMAIHEVNLKELKDGKYEGEFEKYRWKYNVMVNINNQRITSIKIIDDQYSSDSYNKKLINKVIEKQKINIDTVSGATINDKAILKAIEDALN